MMTSGRNEQMRERLSKEGPVWLFVFNFLIFLTGLTMWSNVHYGERYSVYFETEKGVMFPPPPMSMERRAEYPIAIQTNLTIAPGEFILAKTGVQIGLNRRNQVAFITTHSSLLIKEGIIVITDVLPPGVKKNITLSLLNFSKKEITLTKGQNVGRIVFLRLPTYVSMRRLKNADEQNSHRQEVI